jgi:hypothetical protein
MPKSRHLLLVQVSKTYAPICMLHSACIPMHIRVIGFPSGASTTLEMECYSWV